LLVIGIIGRILVTFEVLWWQWQHEALWTGVEVAIQMVKARQNLRYFAARRLLIKLSRVLILATLVFVVLENVGH